MIYTSKNCRPGSSVYALDPIEKISHVVAIDTERGEVTVTTRPLQIDSNTGEIRVERMRFRSIYAIGKPLPELFHCYGRIP